MRKLITLAALLVVALATPAFAGEQDACPQQPPSVTYKFTCPGVNGPANLVAPVKPRPHRRMHQHVERYVPPAQPYIAPAPVYPSPAPVATACPTDGRFHLRIYAWDISRLRPDLRARAEALIAAAEARPTQHGALLRPYQPDDVSRTLGRLIRESGITPAPVNANLQINYLRTSEPTEVAYPVGYAQMRGGIGDFAFSDDPRQWVVETIFPQDFRSPTATDRTGPRRLRLFGYEWNQHLDCPQVMPETGLVILSGGWSPGS